MKPIPCIPACAAIAALLLAGCSFSADTHLAEQEVAAFHRMVDDGQFDAIYAASSDDMKHVTSHDQFVAFVGNVHTRLGHSKSFSEHGWNVNYEAKGSLVTLNYATVYEGGTVQETFVYRVVDGKALLAGYNIK